MDAVSLRSYERLSPFEIKDELIRLARAPHQAAAHAFLNAGRGNPNWIATRARAIFFLLGQFALDEAARTRAHPAGLAGMPRADGIAARLHDWLATREAADTAELIDNTAQRFGFTPDAFVHELADAIIGDNYPVPDRMLVHAEQVVHEYLMQAMCGVPRPAGRFQLFATEGGTAAICYIFRSLQANRLLKPGDRIALGTPIFTPYLEIPELEDYGLVPVHVDAPQENGFQFTDAQLAKLADPAVKAFFLVNPSNPTSVAINPAVRARIAGLVRTQRPDLMLITDDVYATFVDDFRSLLGNCRSTPSASIHSRNTLAARDGAWARSPFTRTTCSILHLHSAGGRTAGARSAAMACWRRNRASSASSTASSPTAAMWRSTTPPGCRRRSRP